MKRKFRVSLMYGPGNSLRVEQVYEVEFAATAANGLIKEHFHDECVYTPGRIESGDQISFGTSASGQRIYVTELHD